METLSNSVNIVLGRVDNRLVHGQIGILWTKHLQATIILVVDDVVYEDYFQQALINKGTKDYEIKILYWSLEKTIKEIEQLKGERIFLITRTPFVMNDLVHAGIKIPIVNLGIMHPDIGKRKLGNNFVYVDDADLDAIAQIKEKGIAVSVKMFPEDEEIIV